MSTQQHPAIEAYARLRKQTDNSWRLDFALLQQMWLHVRGDAAMQPNDYSLKLLRAMSYAFLLSEDCKESEARDQLIDVMQSFEQQYRALAESIGESGEPRMRRTRWTRRLGSNVIVFPQGGRKERP